MSGEFPDGFLLGAATSSYQVEGGEDRTDWGEAAKTGRVPLRGNGCEHDRRFPEDFDLARDLGHNAHRFSIEWARIEPEEGVFDPSAFDHYREVLAALKARGMRPMITLWHFTLPAWLAQRGGFLAPDAPDIFARYCERAVRELEGCDLWITINEPLVYSSEAYLLGAWPPFRKNPFAYLRLIAALERAHRSAYRAIKEVRSDLLVGIAKNNVFFDGGRNPVLRALAWGLDRFRNHRFLSRIRDSQDFIGLNHYYRFTLWGRRDVPKTDMGWEYWPESLLPVLRALSRYGVPIYVTENGIADAADSRRSDFIRRALASVHEAIQGGVPIRGYFHWSLLDNYEWAHGYAMRFGLVEIDRATQERRVRESARVYADICKRNALSLEERTSSSVL